MDYSQRAGVEGVTGGSEPEKINKLWERRRPLWEHLSSTCDQYWVAKNEKEEIVGYARSIVRGDHRELTDFFVLPDNQSAGVGRELIARAFPNDKPHRSIIATTDFRALARYLKSGVYPYLTSFFLEKKPQPIVIDTDLRIEPESDTDTALQTVAEIDSVILGHRRDVDHRFLMQDRTLYIYKRGNAIFGFGYINKDYYGPFAVLDKKDIPTVLAHAETQAHHLGAEYIGFETPAINTLAVDYLMGRGYRIEGFLTSILSNEPFGKFENYLLSSPPFFL